MARPAFFFGPAGPLGCQLRGPPRRRTARSATASLASCAKGMAGPRGPIKGPKKCLFPGNRPPRRGFPGIFGVSLRGPLFPAFFPGFRGRFGAGRPRDLHLHQKSAPETRSKALSGVFFSLESFRAFFRPGRPFCLARPAWLGGEGRDAPPPRGGS